MNTDKLNALTLDQVRVALGDDRFNALNRDEHEINDADARAIKTNLDLRRNFPLTPIKNKVIEVFLANRKARVPAPAEERAAEEDHAGARRHREEGDDHAGVEEERNVRRRVDENDNGEAPAEDPAPAEERAAEEDHVGARRHREEGDDHAGVEEERNVRRRVDENDNGEAPAEDPAPAEEQVEEQVAPDQQQNNGVLLRFSNAVRSNSMVAAGVAFGVVAVGAVLCPTTTVVNALQHTVGALQETAEVFAQPVVEDLQQAAQAAAPAAATVAQAVFTDIRAFLASFGA